VVLPEPARNAECVEVKGLLYFKAGALHRFFQPTSGVAPLVEDRLIHTAVEPVKGRDQNSKAAPWTERFEDVFQRSLFVFDVLQDIEADRAVEFIVKGFLLSEVHADCSGPQICCNFVCVILADIHAG